MAGALAGALTGVLALSFLDAVLTGADSAKELGVAGTVAVAAVNRLVNPDVPLIGPATKTAQTTTPTTKPVVLA